MSFFKLTRRLLVSCFLVSGAVVSPAAEADQDCGDVMTGYSKSISAEIDGKPYRCPTQRYYKALVARGAYLAAVCSAERTGSPFVKTAEWVTRQWLGGPSSQDDHIGWNCRHNGIWECERWEKLTERFDIGNAGQCYSNENAFDYTQGPMSIGYFSTSKHNIQFLSGIDDENGMIYRSWNKPGKAAQGKPDFEMKGKDRTLYADWGWCTRYVFEKGNVRIELNGKDGSENRGRHHCIAGNVPAKAWGEMNIFIDGRKKDHYWLYEEF